MRFLLYGLNIFSWVFTSSLMISLIAGIASVLCPPLVPFSGLIYLASFIMNVENTPFIGRQFATDRENYQEGNTSFARAAWSGVTAGFTSALIYVDPRVYLYLRGLFPANPTSQISGTYAGFPTARIGGNTHQQRDGSSFLYPQRQVVQGSQSFQGPGHVLGSSPTQQPPSPSL